MLNTAYPPALPGFNHEVIGWSTDGLSGDASKLNINAANSTGTSNEGNNDTSSYEKDIITIVHAEYEVN